MHIMSFFLCISNGFIAAIIFYNNRIIYRTTGRKLFYVLDYHPRNRKAVIPAEMQSYLNSLTGSVCQSASNQELLPKVETLGYRMEYNGQKIAESLCPSAAK